MSGRQRLIDVCMRMSLRFVPGASSSLPSLVSLSVGGLTFAESITTNDCGRLSFSVRPCLHASARYNMYDSVVRVC